MNQLVTKAIILRRTDYGEADRILTVLTSDHGKRALMAKGVRRVKSKLAGGIELFSVSEITFIKGRGDMGTLVSARLVKHYGHIPEHIDRTMLGYELIKRLHAATEDEPEPAYFEVLQHAFEALDDAALSLSLVHFWFIAQLLRLGGHTPNLQTDGQGRALRADERYDFHPEDMTFVPNPQRGYYQASHIKILRLVFEGHSPHTLAQIRGIQELSAACLTFVQAAAAHR